MRNKNSRRVLWLAFSCILLTSAFSAETDHQKIETLIRSIPKINVPSPSDNVIVPRHSIGFEGSGSARKELFEQRNELTATLEKMVAFDPNADALFPGSLIQGRSLPDGVLSPITTVRTPLTITITDLISASPSAQFSKTINNPTLASTRAAIQEILTQQLTTQQPAKFVYTSTSMNSVEEGFLRLGASYSWLSGHVSGSYQLSTTNIKSRFMVRYIQRYFTVSANAPSSPASYIAPQEKYSDFANYAGPSNPPSYISSVVYGRELWLLVESSFEANAMKATLDAAFNGGFGSGSVSLTAEQKTMLNTSSMQLLALGGGGTPAVTIITGDKVSGLRDYLLAGANYSSQSPGTIISYNCRYLLDNDIARVSSIADYTIKTSQNSSEKAVTGINFNFLTGSDDKDDDNHVGIRFVLLPANIVLYENPDIRPRQPEDDDPTWHDDRPVPVINGPIQTTVYQSDPKARRIRVDVWKTGGAHWHFGFDFSLRLENGTAVPVGHHNSNDHNFGGNYNSDSWTFDIPW
jgi:hypothetical protein